MRDTCHVMHVGNVRIAPRQKKPAQAQPGGALPLHPDSYSGRPVRATEARFLYGYVSTGLPRHSASHSRKLSDIPSPSALGFLKKRQGHLVSGVSL